MSTERQSVFFMNISAGTLMDKGQELDRKFQSQSVNNPRDIIQAFEASPILNAKKSSEISTYDQDISTRDSSEGREPSRETFRCLKMLVAFTGLVSISALAVSVVILTGIVGSCKCSCQAEGHKLPTTLSTTQHNVSYGVEELSDSLTAFQRHTERKFNQTSNKLRNVSEGVMGLQQKMKNIGVMGPRGPSGYNGSQGPSGRPGPRGSGLSCQYKNSTSHTVTAGHVAQATVSVMEPHGNALMGISCDTDTARERHLSRFTENSKPFYRCTCKGTLDSKSKTMKCFIHYWECSYT